ncbi:MAG: DUF72 domain-containing protein [Acidimicrobiales bacterium]
MSRPPAPAPLELGPVLRLGRARVYTGTCSWTDPTLVKDAAWYPRRSMTAAERLAFYARSFPVVEADSTYYWPPGPELARSWVARTPPGFRLDVKAWSLLTHHPTRPDSLWADLREEVDPAARDKRSLYAHHLSGDALEEAWHRFATALAPLEEAGKLGAVLVQYPTWFTPKRGNREEVARLPDRLEGLRASVELRSPRWLAGDERERTLGLLSEHGLTHVVVDAPAASGLPPVVAVTSQDLAVVRFHGRADDAWSARTASAADRFRYLYDDAELRPWTARVAELAAGEGGADEVHLLMNNCYRDYGVRNAADLGRLLRGAGAGLAG